MNYRIIILCIILIAILGFISARHEINDVYNSQLITSANVLWYLSREELDKKNEERKDIDINDSKLSAEDKDAFNEYAERRLFRLWKNDKMFIYSENSIPESYPPFKAGFSDFDFEGEKWKIYSLHIPGQNIVIEVAEKNRISNYISTGLYYFKSSNTFFKYAHQLIDMNIRVNGEFYIIPVYELLLKNNLKVKIANSLQMWDMGNPEAKTNFEEALNTGLINY